MNALVRLLKVLHMQFCSIRLLNFILVLISNPRFSVISYLEDVIVQRDHEREVGPRAYSNNRTCYLRALLQKELGLWKSDSSAEVLVVLGVTHKNYAVVVPNEGQAFL